MQALAPLGLRILPRAPRLVPPHRRRPDRLLRRSYKSTDLGRPVRSLRLSQRVSRMRGTRRLAELPALSVATTLSRATTRRPLRNALRHWAMCRRGSRIVSLTPPPATASERRVPLSGSESPLTSRNPEAASAPRSLEVAARRIRWRLPTRWSVAAPTSTRGGVRSPPARVGGRRGDRRLCLAVRGVVELVGVHPIGARSAADRVGLAVACPGSRRRPPPRRARPRRHRRRARRSRPRRRACRCRRRPAACPPRARPVRDRRRRRPTRSPAGRR